MNTQRTPHGTIGNAIRRLRKERRWTQVKLAEKVYVTQGAIAGFELGRIFPSHRTLVLMAIEFNVPLEFLEAHRRRLIV